MRKLLLASVATLGTGGLTGAAFAQGPVGAPSQGQVAYPAAPAPTAYVNDNNNYQAPALPGALANPTPGTIVVHINGKVQVDFWGIWTSSDSRFVSAPAGTPGGPPITSIGAGSLASTTSTTPTAAQGAILGNNGQGPVKVSPDAIASFARIYLGADGMATNGLRYGAAIEVRQNFTGQISSNASSGASGYSSLETLYVRRAFTYVAGENWGIVRAGQADGLIGIFDNGVTTFQFLPTGNLNGGDLEGDAMSSTGIPFFFLGQAGNEYDNAKLVYLSPQIAGFDFGVQYAPNTSNGFGVGGVFNSYQSGIINAGNGTGISCAVASSGCPQMSSGPGALDGARALNQTAIGVRYQGSFSGVGLLAYGVYEASGHADYTGQLGTEPAAVSALHPRGVTTGPGAVNLGLTPGLVAAGSTFNGKYDGLNFGSGGIAVTYAGFTVGGNAIGGRLNSQLALTPEGGAPEVAFLVGAKYVNGPFTVGIVAERGDYQGTAQMAGISQRRARAIDFGASYSVAPGYIVYAEYMWQDIYQGGVNMITGATLSPFNNEARSQGFLVGNVVNF